MSFRNDEIIQIQRLLVNCLKECGSFDKTMISISDLCINDIEQSPCLQRINTNDVISLSFEDITNKHVVDYITQCKQLQHVYIKHVSFTYKELSFLSQLECVKQLALRRVNVADTLQPGIINLSSQKQLQVLQLISCMNIEISDLVTEHIEQVCIKDCPNVLDFKLLSNAIRLTDVYIETYNSIRKTCFGKTYHQRHIIDMSRQNHLRTLTLVHNPGIVVTGLNVEQLENVSIQYINEYDNSKDMKRLSYSSKTMELHVKDLTISKATLKPLLQKTTLRQVTLDNVKCDQKKDIHIDLSGHNSLQKLTLVESPGIVITGLNTEQLEHVHIDNSNHYLRSNARKPALELEHLSSARKLTELYLGGQTVNTKTLEILQQRNLRQLNMIHVSGDQHDIHVDLSKLKHLQILKLSDCKNIKISGLNTEQLESVHIINCKCVFDFDLSSNASKLSEINLKCLTGNMASLVSLVEHASLRQLTLKGVTHCQSDVEGQTHEIPVDLSEQNHLQILNMSDCKQIQIIGLNIEELKEVHISKCKCLFDFGVLSNACKLSEIHLEGLTGNIASLVSLVEHASLRQLTLKGVTHCQPDVEGQTHEIPVDLSEQNHLQILKMSDCKNMKIIGLNIEELILIGLKEEYSLRQLTWEGVTHYQAESEGQTHEIHVDLSKQDHIQICTLLDCQNINISDLNTEHFEWFQHEKCPGKLKIELFGNARRLTNFMFTGQVLGDRYQFRKQRGNVIHTLHRLRKLNLENVDIGANALTLIPELVFLTSIFLKNTKMSIDTWRAFVDSLLTLQQSVSVDTIVRYERFCANANAESKMRYHYVKDDPLFKLTKDHGSLYFCFQRR
jgi:primosomal replication protein N